jgi:hypothetical protein
MVRPIQTALNDAAEISLVKVLDLLTNRYHTGIVRATAAASAGDETLYLELPASARLAQGQRVRFIIADGRRLIAKRSMRRAEITAVLPEGPAHLHVQLQTLADPTIN